MIMQRGIIPLARRGHDLLHGHAIDAAPRKQQLCRGLDLVLGFFRSRARARCDLLDMQIDPTLF